MNALLVEPSYGTTMPSPALMKLSSWLKSRGNQVVFVRGNKKESVEPDVIYMTSVFTFNRDKIFESIRFYNESFPGVPIVLGGIYATCLTHDIEEGSLGGRLRDDWFLFLEGLKGANVSLHKGIHPEAEEMPLDYSLYPKYPGSLIAASRGCRNKCSFCAIPLIEGGMHSCKPSIKHLLRLYGTEVTFFDNNFLASPFALNIIEELLDADVKVDFNQGLDCRRITPEFAQKLHQLRMDDIRLACDNPAALKPFKEAVEMLVDAGFPKWKIFTYCLYNYQDTPEELIFRMEELARLGVRIYPMRYQSLDSLTKNEYIGVNWTREKLDHFKSWQRVVSGNTGVISPKAILGDTHPAKFVNNKTHRTSKEKKANSPRNLQFNFKTGSVA